MSRVLAKPTNYRLYTLSDLVCIPLWSFSTKEPIVEMELTLITKYYDIQVHIKIYHWSVQITQDLPPLKPAQQHTSKKRNILNKKEQMKISVRSWYQTVGWWFHSLSYFIFINDRNIFFTCKSCGNHSYTSVLYFFIPPSKNFLRIGAIWRGLVPSTRKY